MWRTRLAGVLACLGLALALIVAFDAVAQSQRPQRQQQQRTQPPLPPEPQVEPQPVPQGEPPPAPRPVAPPAASPAAEQPPVPVRVVPAPKSKEELAVEQEQRERSAALETKLLVLAGLVVAVGLFLVAAFAVQALYLWLALRAMRRSAELAERNMVIAQRAFVYVGSLAWSVAGTNVKLSPTWENSGATPTRSLRVSTNWRAWHGELPGDAVYNYNRPPERLFLGPKAKAEVGSLLIPMRDIQAAIEGRVHLYVWGRATYEDVFEGNEPHFVEFCHRLEVAGTPPDAIALTFTLYGAHNRTDEDSQRPAAPEPR